MPRVKRGVIHNKTRKSLRKSVKGYKAGRRNTIRLAKTAANKAGAHAYTGRKLKKRTYRTLWQTRINAAVREHDLSYSKFMDGLKKANIEIDRKILAKLASDHPKVFAAIVKEIKK